MKHNDPNKAVRNRRSNKKRNNNSTKVRDLVNAVRRNAQGKMKRMCNRFISEKINVLKRNITHF